MWYETSVVFPFILSSTINANNISIQLHDHLTTLPHPNEDKGLKGSFEPFPEILHLFSSLLHIPVVVNYAIR